MAQESHEESPSARPDAQEAGAQPNRNKRNRYGRRNDRRHGGSRKNEQREGSETGRNDADFRENTDSMVAELREGAEDTAIESTETPKRQDRSERRPRQDRGERFDRSQRGPRSAKPSISVVIPLLNEEESLNELAARLAPVLETESAGRYEVIFIDDGSTDSSFEVLRALNRRNGRFHALRFRRNYGKSAALAVGFAAAKNDVVITMDADLQDDPLEIPNLVAKINEGYDLVSGWKKRRKDPLEKRLPSKFFNFVTSTVSGIKLHDFNCGLKAYRKDVIKTVQVYGEMHRYIPALAHWEGFRIAELPVTHHARKFGNSKFGFSRYFKGFLDLLTVVFTTRFIKRPLHLFGTLGALFTLVGFGIDLMLSIEWFLHQTSLTNRPLMLMGVAFIIVGVQLISIGLIGEMIVKNNLSHAEYSIKERL